MVDYNRDREQLKTMLCGSQDVLILDFNIGGIAACIIYADGMSDKELTDRNIIQPLKQLCSLEQPYLPCLNQHTYIADPITEVESLEQATLKIADGDMIMLIDGADTPYLFSMRNYKTRGISEPPVSTVLRGPREGFVEDMKTNMTMLRRRLRTPKLVFKYMKGGKYTQSNIAVAYLDGVAEQNVIDEVQKRIEAIEIDGLIDASYVARYLEENQYSIFSQTGMSEKPDIVTSKMLEGRVAIIVDGSPTVLTVPFIMLEHFQSSQDYYIKCYRATITRIIRFIAMIIAIALPAAYVALQEFQYQMLPLKMLLTIMNSIYGLPLTPMLEMLLLLILFEVLNETSIRMPKPVGAALSIVGAIVLGEAAINAGLLSTPSLLVTAVSTIGLYGVPDEADAASILRLGFVFIAGVLGLYGLLLAVVGLIVYLVSIKSYGVSYLMPFAPLYSGDLQDGIMKADLLDMTKRPYSIPTHNRNRMPKD